MELTNELATLSGKAYMIRAYVATEKAPEHNPISSRNITLKIRNIPESLMKPKKLKQIIGLLVGIAYYILY